MKIGDFFKFKRKHSNEIITGRITGENGNYWLFTIVSCNRPGKVGKTGAFLKEGKVSSKLEIITDKVEIQ